MSRKLKRVPLDFSWPLRQIWSGYIRPPEMSGMKCQTCNGDGSSPESRRLTDQWYGNAPFKPEDRGSTPFKPNDDLIVALAQRNLNRAAWYYGSGAVALSREAERLCAHFNKAWSHHLNQDDIDALLAAGRLCDLTSIWDSETRKWVEVRKTTTPREVNEWSLSGIGHDSINQWIVVGAETKRRGVPDTCAVCGGHGDIYRDDAHKTACDAWTESEPPEGEGWQMWETTTEGSPISPVFATDDELARYLAANEPEDGNYHQWMAVIKSGWAPSLMMIDGVVMTGVEAVGDGQIS